MTSAAQITANRENSTHSTGLKTEESKSRTRLNALRHGLTGQVTVMPGEDREAFQKFCAEIVKDLAPQGAIETQLAQSIGEDNWRLNRGRAIESNILALGFANATDPTGHGEIDAALTGRNLRCQHQTIPAALALHAAAQSRHAKEPGHPPPDPNRTPRPTQE